MGIKQLPPPLNPLLPGERKNGIGEAEKGSFDQSKLLYALKPSATSS
jgi:hypothetical protein